MTTTEAESKQLEELVGADMQRLREEHPGLDEALRLWRESWERFLTTTGQASVRRETMPPRRCYRT